MSLSQKLLMGMRVGAALQVIVGIALWTGHLYSFVNVHMLVGVLFVLLLWAIAGIAISHRRGVGLAVFAIAWGVLVAGFGMTQQGILPGDLHWIVRVMHLVIGLAAMPIAERLAGSPARASLQPA
jgi:hypothetical protein